MIKKNTTLGHLTVTELIKNANTLEEVIKLPGLTEDAIEAINDLLFCVKRQLQINKQAAQHLYNDL